MKLQPASSWILGLPVLLLASNCNGQQVPIVNTTSGLLRGFSPYPNVHAYLGIPYAQPPIGDLRFAPPQPYNSSEPRDCYESSPGCFQLTYITPFADRSTGVAESEDMMSINIWKPATEKKNLPVLIFIHGGAFTSGANGMFQYNGVNFVAEQKDIIFVSINYRVNIFGFPNSAAIKSKNPGLLDQRLAVEWLRDNIVSFGGDPNRMTLSGQSAGAMSVVFWSHAYGDDPIVSGLIELSGQPGVVVYDTGSSWKAISNITGCSNTDVDVELSCMRGIPARDLKRVMSPNNTPSYPDPVISGGTPVVDNVTVFSIDEYTARGQAGNVTNIPLLIAHTTHEADAVLPFTATGGVDQTFSNAFTLSAFQCPAAASANYSSSAGVPTWRYVYNGSFAETLPYSWMRPHHGADLTLIMGLEKATAYEEPGEELVKAGVYLRGAVAAFVRDPREGLVGYGWPRYDADAPTLVTLFGNNSAAVTFENPSVYDAPCATL